jgi:DNA polymerase III subunit epsilon
MSTPEPKGHWLRYAVLTAVPTGPIAGALVVWTQLTTTQREALQQMFRDHPASIVTVGFGLMAGLALGVYWVFQNYVDPLKRLSEDIGLIITSNPSHRTSVTGHPDLIKLANSINHAAEMFRQQQEGVEARIAVAKTEIERERNVLAALIHELTDGVLVCTSEGQILLFNKRAHAYLKGVDDANALSTPLGIGRSVFAFIDRGLIGHAIEELSVKLNRGDSHPVSHVVTTGALGHILHIEAVPLTENGNAMRGFILVIRDITDRTEEDGKREYLIQSLSEGSRTSLATIQTAAETLKNYDSMDAVRQKHFIAIIHDETVALSERLDKTSQEYARERNIQWPLEDALCYDFLSAVKVQAERTLDVSASIDCRQDALWVKIDSYSLLQLFLFLINEMRRIAGVMDFQCRASLHNAFVTIDLLWKGSLLPPVTLREWREHQLFVQGRGTPSTLHNVLDRHNAELWTQSEPDGKHSYLRLLLPKINPSKQPGSFNTSTIASRPEFYDFDLFDRPPTANNLAREQLAGLAYVAFDTETTGLLPHGGDEIMAISGVRIVNGRLLHNDSLDRLVDPQRTLPAEAMRLTGIQPEMLKGQPRIESALKEFQSFIENAVLIGHNAAFDMRFFQIKESSTGIAILNPVLDTLLLSSIIHPNQENHSIEAIAKRLGVNIIGRHTALGDAIVTGEIFLKLLPLLHEKGIRTLHDAVEASKRSYYARLKY